MTGSVVRRRVTVAILGGYALSVAAITLLPIQRHSAEYWAGDPWWMMVHWIPFLVDAPSFLLNVIMFTPFGVLVAVLWRRFDGYRALAWCAAGASAVIELAQLVLGLTLGSRRTVDVNDLIANTAGALLGLAILRLALPHAAHRAQVAPPISPAKTGSPR